MAGALFICNLLPCKLEFFHQTCLKQDDMTIVYRWANNQCVETFPLPLLCSVRICSLVGDMLNFGSRGRTFCQIDCNKKYRGSIT